MMNQPRAWQLEHCEMCEVTAIDYNGERLGFGRQLDDEHFNEPDYWLRMDECVILRPTGLYDRKGVEIFEADITKTITTDVLKNYIEPVVWDAYQCKFNIVGYGIHLCEVVGNIYENPELLKEFKE